MIARPQNHCQGHIRYSRDDPIFITCLQADLEKVHKGLQEGDIAMMFKRLKVFEFHTKLLNPSEIPACPKCWSDFLFENGPEASSTTAARPSTPGASSKRTAPGPTGSSPDTKRPTTWSVAEVGDWLDKVSLGHLATRFYENGVDGEFFEELSEENLVGELGLTPLQAKKLKMRWASQ